MVEWFPHGSPSTHASFVVISARHAQEINWQCHLPHEIALLWSKNTQSCLLKGILFSTCFPGKHSQSADFVVARLKMVFPKFQRVVVPDPNIGCLTPQADFHWKRNWNNWVGACGQLVAALASKSHALQLEECVYDCGAIFLVFKVITCMLKSNSTSSDSCCVNLHDWGRQKTFLSLEKQTEQNTILQAQQKSDCCICLAYNITMINCSALGVCPIGSK